MTRAVIAIPAAAKDWLICVRRGAPIRLTVPVAESVAFPDLILIVRWHGPLQGAACLGWLITVGRRGQYVDAVNAAERAGSGTGPPLAVPVPLPPAGCSRWLAVFQDQPEFAEVLRHRGLDPGGRGRGSEPQQGMGGIEFHVVDEPCRAGPGL